MSHKKPILGLLVLCTLIPELFTASTSLIALINPITLFWTCVTYGIAILFLREIATRFNLNYGGIFILGMVYSFFNEGFIAKSYLIFHDDPTNILINLPVDFLANMGNFFGLNFGFIITSAVWHGVGSVLIPICFIHYLYPESAETPWLKKSTTIFLGLLLSLIGTVNFFGPEKIQGTPGIFITIVGCMTFLSIIAFRMKRNVMTFTNPAVTKPFRLFLLGLSIGVFYLVILNIIGSMGKLIPYLIVFTLGVTLYIKILKKKEWLSAGALIFFGIGFYAQTLVLPLFVVPSPVNVITTIISYIILGVTYVKLQKRQGGV